MLNVSEARKQPQVYNKQTVQSNPAIKSNLGLKTLKTDKVSFGAKADAVGRVVIMPSLRQSGEHVVAAVNNALGDLEELAKSHGVDLMIDTRRGMVPRKKKLGLHITLRELGAAPTTQPGRIRDGLREFGLRISNPDALTQKYLDVYRRSEDEWRNIPPTFLRDEATHLLRMNDKYPKRK